MENLWKKWKRNKRDKKERETLQDEMMKKMFWDRFKEDVQRAVEELKLEGKIK